uniref:Uncharacterized protein n=1 Tax=Toxoplasma gondii (strain ATCC 50861 / VEG) TaxID=432359 RepID=A0A0F7V357_TOXGV|nr:TPA: hypothetical protein BN1205_019300 [Toxoplasma gondii VEG]
MKKASRVTVVLSVSLRAREPRVYNSDVFPVNQPGEQYLPDSHNDYAEYVIVNSPNTTVRNFGTNANKNVLINNARGPVRVEFSTHAPSTATLKTFDNTGTAMVEGQPPSLA